MPFDASLEAALRAPPRTLNSQVAAIPVRWTERGPEVLLITSRKRGRWIVPKGWAECDSAAIDCAAREAFEEAGVSGCVEPYSLGEFEYWRKSKGGKLFFSVTAYALHVDHVHAEWPDRDARKRAWFAPEVAARLAANDALGALIRAAVQVKFKAPTGAMN